jgi:hypothetical protein
MLTVCAETVTTWVALMFALAAEVAVTVVVPAPTMVSVAVVPDVSD